MPEPITETAAAAPAAQPAGSTSPAVEPNKEAQSVREQNLLARSIAAERERDALKASVKAAEDAKLAEQGKYQELAKSKEVEANTWKGKWEQSQRTNMLIAAAAEVGIKPTAITDLASLPSITAIDASDTDALRAAAVKVVADLRATFGNQGVAPFPTPTPSPGGAPKSNNGAKVADVHKMTPDELKAYLSEASRAPLKFGGR